MTRRTPRKTPPKTPPETPEEVIVPEAGEDTMISEDESPVLFQSEHPEDVVWITRLDEKDMKWQFVCKLLPEECTVERVAQVRGGGRYRATLKGPDPERGHDVFKRRRSFSVDGPGKPLNMNAPPPRVAGQSAPTLGAAVESGQRVSVDDILSAGILQLFQTQQQVNQTMVQAVKEVRSQSTDWGEIVGKMIPLVTAIVQQRQAKPEVDPLVLITKVGELLKSTTSPGSSFKDIIETMNGFLDLRDRSAPDDGSTGDPILDIVRENLPKVIGVIQQEQLRRGVPVTSKADLERGLTKALPPATVQPPEPTAGATAPPPLPEGAMTQGPLLNFLQARRKPWAKYAMTGRDPGVCAAFEWEMLPEDYRGAVREFLAQEGALQQVVDLLPEAQGYKQWYTDFLNAFHATVFPELYEEADIADDDGEEPDDGVGLVPEGLGE